MWHRQRKRQDPLSPWGFRASTGQVKAVNTGVLEGRKEDPAVREASEKLVKEREIAQARKLCPRGTWCLP